MKTKLLMIASVLFFASVAYAQINEDQPGQLEDTWPAYIQNRPETSDTDLKLRRIIDHYNTAMAESDFDTAEAIAIGAAAKYGDEQPVIHGMLFGAANALRERAGLPKLQAPDLRPTNVDETITVRLYHFHDLPIWSKDSAKASTTLLEHFLASKLGSQEMQNVKMVADHTSSRLFIRASNASHKLIESSLRDLSREE